ncbi:MAG: MerR family transcriptional regulator [Polyangiaceae bacterium]|nr:MerR family transcriptional regulator [Polyangiaceae bacterium]
MSTSDPNHDSPQLRRKDGLLTTGDMARLSSNTLRTVRFYEEAGLLRPVQRTDGGHRLFPPSELRKLHLVSDLRAAGFSLEEIGEMLDAKQKSDTPRGAAQDILGRLEQQIASMRSRLLLLERLLVELERARRVIHRCANCPAPDRFPAGCNDCTAIEEPDGSIANAVGVLWSIDRD